jgi:hypothetical protein
VIYLNVTAHPAATWIAQLLFDSFPEDTTTRFLLRDRDAIYGHVFVDRVKGLGIEEILTAQQNPGQNAYCERFLGSPRRDCLDHVIILS